MEANWWAGESWVEGGAELGGSLRVYPRPPPDMERRRPREPCPCARDDGPPAETGVVPVRDEEAERGVDGLIERERRLR